MCDWHYYSCEMVYLKECLRSYNCQVKDLLECRRWVNWDCSQCKDQRDKSNRVVDTVVYYYCYQLYNQLLKLTDSCCYCCCCIIELYSINDMFYGILSNYEFVMLFLSLSLTLRLTFFYYSNYCFFFFLLYQFCFYNFLYFLNIYLISF